jgi:hypothetical protein
MRRAKTSEPHQIPDFILRMLRLQEENKMIFCIEDISQEYVTIFGGVCRPATHLDPEEYTEVERTVSECFGGESVFLLSDRDKRFAKIDSDDAIYPVNGVDVNIYKIVENMLDNEPVSSQDFESLVAWFEEEATTEKKVYDDIESRGADLLAEEDFIDYGYYECHDFI